MNRSLAALAAGAMLLASAPTLGFADEMSASSSSSSSSTSVSSSSSSSSVTSSSSSMTSSSSSSTYSKAWQAPCDELKGLLKAQCIVKHNPGKGNKKDRVQRKNDDKVIRLSGDCAALEGMEKVKCLRTHGKAGIKHEIKKAVKKAIMRTIRGKDVEESSDSSESSESSED